MRKIFLDTCGILALVNKRDFLHKKAVELNDRLSFENIRYFTSEYILVEACNALSRNNKLAIQILQNLQNSSDIEIFHIDDATFNESIKLYTKFLDKDWGLTDISSFIIMKRLKISEAFTDDNHFEQFGFISLLK